MRSTSVQKIMKRYKISAYKLVQTMGLSPSIHQGKWAEKIKGKTLLDEFQLNNLKKALAKLTEGIYKIEIEYKAARFIIK